MKNIALILKPGTPQVAALVNRIGQFIKGHDVQIYCAKENRTELKGVTTVKPKLVNTNELKKYAQVMLVLGGDGTFLRATQAVYGTTIPLIGINLGKLGFLTEVNPADLETTLEAILKGHIHTEIRAFYEISHYRGGKLLGHKAFVNDAVMQRNADEKVIQYAAFIDGHYMSSARVDGVIVASPTGSTAYNLSAGGPILYPTLEGLVLLPICPHKVSYRPVILPPVAMKIELRSERCLLSLDGQPFSKMKKGDFVIITPSHHKLHLASTTQNNFFDLLRTKLGWDSAR
jgi:NAD+ kinase